MEIPNDLIGEIISKKYNYCNPLFTEEEMELADEAIRNFKIEKLECKLKGMEFYINFTNIREEVMKRVEHENEILLIRNQELWKENERLKNIIDKLIKP